VLNELDALVNFDLEERKVKSKKTKLTFVRIGTCGALQAEIPAGSFILSKGSFGLDNVSHFYEIKRLAYENEILQAFKQHVNFPENIAPYFTLANEHLNLKLAQHEKVNIGFTVTSTGFYGPQGRALRLPLQIPDLNDAFSSFDFNGERIANLEMESSAIFALSRGLGHDAACICVALANRKRGDFLEDYKDAMNALIQHVLRTLIAL
jgi:uridine phosphorylase